MLLDQAELEHECGHFILGYQPVELGSGVHHDPGARPEVTGEVVGRPLANGLGLADVENAAFIVLEHVDAGRVWNRRWRGTADHSPDCIGGL